MLKYKITWVLSAECLNVVGMSALLSALSSPGLEEVQRNKVIDCNCLVFQEKYPCCYRKSKHDKK